MCSSFFFYFFLFLGIVRVAKESSLAYKQFFFF